MLRKDGPTAVHSSPVFVLTLRKHTVPITWHNVWTFSANGLQKKAIFLISSFGKLEAF